MEKTSLRLKNILDPIEENICEFNTKILENFSSDNILIDKISTYIMNSGGKKLRPSLVFLFAKMLGEVKKEHYNLACAVELIHSATLVHDDIIDDADKRRNQKTIHTKWNTKTAVLAGDYLLAKALKHLIKTQKNEILELFTQITEEICQGEVEQFTNTTDFSTEGYINKAKRKTGMLFSLCTQGACHISADKNILAAKNYALNIGIAFQIADDLLLFKENYNEKSLKTDFKNSTFTLPVILATQNGAEIDFDCDFETFKKQILNTNAIDKSYALALKYSQQAIENISNFEDNQYKASLCDLAKYIVDREF